MYTPKQKIAVIGSVGVPAKYGGFETLVHHLVLNLGTEFDLNVYCSGKTYPVEERMTNWEGAQLHYIPLKANGIQSILYDLWSMIKALKTCDKLLVLGVSGCLFLPFIKLFTDKTVIVNIDGLEWRRPKWNWLAKRFLLLSERIACTFADEVITDNHMIKEYAKIRYGVEGRLIEYGADHVFPVTPEEEDVKRYAFLKENYAFKVARIEPENNVHMILEAFAALPNQPLVIVGNWANSSYGRSLKKAYQTKENITLLDPIYNERELNLLRSNAHFYVHGHSAGGTNPSLVEAMYLGLPVLTYDVIYNRVSTNNQAIFYSTAEDLYKLIRQIDRQPLAMVAHNLKSYADRKYTWKYISNCYGNLFAGNKRMTPRLDEEFEVMPLRHQPAVLPQKARSVEPVI
ncbi:MAG: DUF1972 domain-containing protein [Bacteroidota bacterium]